MFLRYISTEFISIPDSSLFVEGTNESCTLFTSELQPVDNEADTGHENSIDHRENLQKPCTATFHVESKTF